MEYSSETQVEFQQTTWLYILEDGILYKHRCENLKSCKAFFIPSYNAGFRALFDTKLYLISADENTEKTYIRFSFLSFSLISLGFWMLPTFHTIYKSSAFPRRHVCFPWWHETQHDKQAGHISNTTVFSSIVNKHSVFLISFRRACLVVARRPKM